MHNIIVGKLWVDNHGEMDIINNSNGDICHLKYNAYSYFSRETPRKVKCDTQWRFKKKQKKNREIEREYIQ